MSITPRSTHWRKVTKQQQCDAESTGNTMSTPAHCWIYTPERLNRTGLEGEAWQPRHIRRQESSGLCSALALDVLQKQPVHAIKNQLRGATGPLPYIDGHSSGSHRANHRWYGCIVVHHLSNSLPRKIRAHQHHKGCGISYFLGPVVIGHLGMAKRTAASRMHGHRRLVTQAVQWSPRKRSRQSDVAAKSKHQSITYGWVGEKRC